MAVDVYSREQRLRKRAELQSLYSNLAGLRKQEASYIAVSAAIPELLINQINEVRHAVEAVENELRALGDETLQTPAHQFYRDAFETDQAGDIAKANKLYKSAARYEHPDAEAAIRSLRYRIKISKNRSAAGKVWLPTPASRAKNRLLTGLAIVLTLLLIVILVVAGRFLTQLEGIAVVTPTSPVTPTPVDVILIIPETATLIPTNTPMPTPTPTSTSTPIPTVAPIATPTEALPTETPTPVLPIRAAPKVIGPSDGLVWVDGAIVFEFEDLDLAYDELYCLSTLKGFDKTNTENWSFPPIGNKEPAIPIEANVFRIARAQGMRCILWSANIGKGSCDNVISASTEPRSIGLPRPCDFR